MKKYFLITIVFFFTIPVFSQIGSICSPFVSRIKSTAEESSVKITWDDSKDISGTCIIYRHTSEINSNNLSESIVVGEVLQGIEFFEDYPQKAYTNYYYTVLIRDGKNFLHEVFVPFRNKTTNPVSITKVQKRDSSYLDPAKIDAIKTSVFVDSIVIKFECNKPSSEIFIYRSASPIKAKKDILASHHIATISGSKAVFADYPIPGVDYYYSAIDSILIKSGNFTIEEDKNTTGKAVKIPLNTAVRVGLPKTASSRANPLPLLSISKGYKSGKDLSPSFIDTMPQYKSVSKKTEAIINEVTEKIKISSTEDLRPVILKENRSPEKGSEDELLLNILKEDFETYNYSKARERLLEFQKIERSKDIDASVHFYLGQIYYFLRQYNKAFVEFVFSEEYFFTETLPWKNDAYKKLREGKSSS